MPQSFNGLEIVPLATTSKYKHPPVKYESMPQHEFSMLIVAPKGSGKTNLICNLLLNHYKGYFHRIIISSPTVLNDPKWMEVKKTKGILLENKKLKSILNEGVNPYDMKKIPKIAYGKGEKYVPEDVKVEKPKWTGIIPAEDFVENVDDILPIIEHQNETISKLEKMGYGEKSKYLSDRVLVILDDQAGLFKAGNNNNPFVNYIFKHRHSNTSVILVTQANRAVPKSVRTNMNAGVFFENANASELATIYEEWPCFLPEDVWMGAFNHCTNDPYGFMYINNHFKKGERIYKNFDKLMRISVGEPVVEPPSEDVQVAKKRKRE